MMMNVFLDKYMRIWKYLCEQVPIFLEQFVPLAQE